MKKKTNTHNEKQLDIKFIGKKELYNFYGVKIFIHPYEIVMSKNMCNDGKQVHMYRLINKENEQQESVCITDNVRQKQNLQSDIHDELTCKDKKVFNNQPLNIEFGGLKDLYAFYDTNSFPNIRKIKESRQTIDGKRFIPL